MLWGLGGEADANLSTGQARLPFAAHVTASRGPGSGLLPLQQQLCQRREERSDERHVVSRHRDKFLVAAAERLCPGRRLHRIDVLEEFLCDGGIQRGFLDCFSQVVEQIGRFDTDHICGRVR